MEDDRVVISSGVSLTPEAVYSRTFASAFRGYNPEEVRSFLKRIGDELEASAERESELRRNMHDLMARVAHPELSEEMLTNALGEHAARLLTNARETAASITGDAEARAARLLRDAEERIGRMRGEVDTLMARRMQEVDGVAAQLRQAAETDARALREQARVEAEAHVQAARSEGREMVAEARSVRERMLSDLARRRHTAQTQIDQLRSARERILEAFAVARRSLDEATDQLNASDTQARLAAEAALHRAGPVPELPQFDVTSSAAPEARSAPLEARAAPLEARATRPESRPSVAPDPRPPAGAEARPAAAENRPGRTLVDERAAWVRERLARLGAPASGGAPGEASGSSAAVSQAGTAPPAPTKPSPAPAPATAPSPSPSTAPSLPAEARQASGAGPSESSGGQVDELFARLRQGQAASSGPEAESSAIEPVPGHENGNGNGVAESKPKRKERGRGRRRGADEASGPEAAVSPAEASPADEPSLPAPAGSDEAMLQRRDEALEPLESALARKLKRVLQDDQNEALDNLRKAKRPSVESVLPPAPVQAERFKGAAIVLLEQAALAGRALHPGSPASGVGGGGLDPQGWAAELAREVVVPLRQRLERVLADSGGHGTEAVEGGDAGEGAEMDMGDADVTEALSAAYREWRIHQLERLARHHVTLAFAKGAFAAVPEGNSLRWVVDDDGAPCPDCDDNALAGPTVKGQAYPTGQPHPPAHPGCRCLLVPAAP